MHHSWQDLSNKNEWREGNGSGTGDMYWINGELYIHPCHEHMVQGVTKLPADVITLSRKRGSICGKDLILGTWLVRKNVILLLNVPCQDGDHVQF